MLTVWRCHAPKRAFFCFEPAVRSTIIDGDATRPETSAHDSDNATKHLNAQCETNGTNKSQEGRKLARRDLKRKFVVSPPRHWSKRCVMRTLSVKLLGRTNVGSDGCGYYDSFAPFMRVLLVSFSKLLKVL